MIVSYLPFSNYADAFARDHAEALARNYLGDDTQWWGTWPNPVTNGSADLNGDWLISFQDASPYTDAAGIFPYTSLSIGCTPEERALEQYDPTVLAMLNGTYGATGGTGDTGGTGSTGP